MQRHAIYQDGPRRGPEAARIVLIGLECHPTAACRPRRFVEALPENRAPERGASLFGKSSPFLLPLLRRRSFRSRHKRSTSLIGFINLFLPEIE
jgi:hypothetical protein